MPQEGGVSAGLHRDKTKEAFPQGYVNTVKWVAYSWIENFSDLAALVRCTSLSNATNLEKHFFSLQLVSYQGEHIGKLDHNNKELVNRELKSLLRKIFLEDHILVVVYSR